jgi:1-acyl-sn-glycerol-3-phosphate acyltransferase
MIFGEPLDFSRYYGMEDDRLVQRAVTDEIMYELMRLSGQEYVDEYAAVVKLRLAGKSSAPMPAGRGTTADAAGAGTGLLTAPAAGPAAQAPGTEAPARDGQVPEAPVRDGQAAEGQELPAAAGDEDTASSGSA